MRIDGEESYSLGTGYNDSGSQTNTGKYALKFICSNIHNLNKLELNFHSEVGESLDHIAFHYPALTTLSLSNELPYDRQLRPRGYRLRHHFQTDAVAALPHSQ